VSWETYAVASYKLPALIGVAVHVTVRLDLYGSSHEALPRASAGRDRKGARSLGRDLDD
jgi:hypothetical protein